MVEFTGMASQLHPPREKDGNEYLSRVSWWRPPYVASFRSGRLKFVLAAAHIRWGSGGIGPRANEIAMLADWAVRYATPGADLFLVGDFNIPSLKSEAFQVLEARGITVPEALAGVFGTDLAQGKRYDQILVSGGNFTEKGGGLDFYRGAHRALYPRLNKTKFTFQMSDHLPLWAEVGCW
jgi:endonuclease/exonuclease/phosphatase family metal-dependent hydrolase